MRWSDSAWEEGARAYHSGVLTEAYEEGGQWLGPLIAWRLDALKEGVIGLVHRKGAGLLHLRRHRDALLSRERGGGRPFPPLLPSSSLSPPPSLLQLIHLTILFFYRNRHIPI